MSEWLRPEENKMQLMRPLRVAVVIATVAAAPVAAQPAKHAAPAAALPTAAATTMNCLLASNLLAAKESDQKMKTLAEQTAYFYLGRLDPRISPPQLKLDLKRSADNLRGVNAARLMNDCLHELQTKGQLFQSVGQKLQQGK